MMNELHAQGKTIEDVKEVLRRVPIHPRIVPTIKTLHALGYFLGHNVLVVVLFIISIIIVIISKILEFYFLLGVI